MQILRVKYVKAQDAKCLMELCQIWSSYKELHKSIKKNQVDFINVITRKVYEALNIVVYSLVND